MNRQSNPHVLLSVALDILAFYPAFERGPVDPGNDDRNRRLWPTGRILLA